MQLAYFVKQISDSISDGISAATTALVPDAVLRAVAPRVAPAVGGEESELSRLNVEMEAMKGQLADQQKAGMSGEIVIDRLRATKLCAHLSSGYLPSPCLRLELRGRDQMTKKAAHTTSPSWETERLVFAGVRGELTTPTLRAALVEWGTMGEQPLVHASAELDLKPLRGRCLYIYLYIYTFRSVIYIALTTHITRSYLYSAHHSRLQGRIPFFPDT